MKQVKCFTSEVIVGWGLVLFILFSIIHLAANAQEHKFNNKTTIVLFSADALVRTLDAASTRANLTNPCKCFTESNTAWASGTTPGQYAYSLGYVGVEYGLAYLAHRRGWHRLERAIPSIDIVYDGRAMMHNYAISNPQKIAPVVGTPSRFAPLIHR